MAKIFAHLRLIAGALALAVVFAMATPAPVSAQSGPTAATSEQQLLNQLRGGAISGQVSIPDKKAGNLIHPAGREWREFRTVTLKWIGGIAIFGMLALLILFYLWRGTMRIEGGRSGRTIVRFTAFERFVHWLTASSFVILGLTGLNVSFGRSLLLPLMSPQAFSDWSEWAKYVHNFLSFAFTIGVVLMFLMWIGQNFPTAADVEWLKIGGGMGKGRQRTCARAQVQRRPEASLLAHRARRRGHDHLGFMLMFPFYYGLNVGDMELSEVFHGVVGVLFIALIIAHIYLGTLGMEGAFESMADGTVDLNWAKEHHNLWVEEEMQSGASGRMRPAE